jgi:tetratricopeptide (TPR) repeat protein
LLLPEQGRFSEAIKHAKKAQSIDPVSLSICANAATVLHFAGRYDEAMEESRRALAADPEFFRALWITGISQEQRGNAEEAIRGLESAAHLSPRHPAALGALGHVYGGAGKTVQAKRILQTLSRAQQDGVYGFAMSITYLGLGDIGGATKSLDQAFRNKEFEMVLLKVDRRLNKLRSTAHFQRILEQMHFPV